MLSSSITSTRRRRSSRFPEELGRTRRAPEGPDSAPIITPRRRRFLWCSGGGEGGRLDESSCRIVCTGRVTSTASSMAFPPTTWPSSSGALWARMVARHRQTLGGRLQGGGAERGGRPDRLACWADCRLLHQADHAGARPLRVQGLLHLDCPGNRNLRDRG